jgi:hypothetical protein
MRAPSPSHASPPPGVPRPSFTRHKTCVFVRGRRARRGPWVCPRTVANRVLGLCSVDNWVAPLTAGRVLLTKLGQRWPAHLVAFSWLLFALRLVCWPTAPQLPTPMKYSNRLCYAREVEAQQRLHRHRLATVRPTSRTNSR